MKSYVPAGLLYGKKYMMKGFRSQHVKKRKLLFDCACISSTCYDIRNSMLIPILPTIEKKLHISSFQVSMIITIYSIVAILLIPIAGYLSDRWGRKMVMVPSLLIAAIGGAITGWVSWKVDNPYTWILIGRAIQGIGAAGAMPVVIPCVGDLYKDEKQVSTGLGIIRNIQYIWESVEPYFRVCSCCHCMVLAVLGDSSFMRSINCFITCSSKGKETRRRSTTA